MTVKDYISNYNKREFRGEQIYFVDHRISKEDMVEGYHYYDCRGGDDDIFRPCTIERSVWCNFAGTVISKNRLVFDNPIDTPYGVREYILLTEEEVDTLVSGYTDLEDEEEE